MSQRNEFEDELEEDTQRDKYLIFSLGNQFYGIEIKFVTEIIGIQPIAEVPDLPEYIKGIINLRGKIIPVMDVRLRFSMGGEPYNDRTCIIVIDINDRVMGLIVESVSEVLPIAPSEIVAAPDVQGSGRGFVTGIGKIGTDVKLLVDCEMLLRDNVAVI